MAKDLTLLEILEELEKDEKKVPDGIFIFPPDNANADNTDEDSGEEDNVAIENLPGRQLLGEEEVLKSKSESDDEDYDSDDDLPLAVIAKKIKLQKPQPPKKKNYIWEKKDLISSFPAWNSISGCTIKLSPVEIFQLFFDDEVINAFVRYSNMYASAHNRIGDIQPSEIRCFFGILLLSGYVRLPRREMYWENSNDTHNELVCEAMSRNRFRYIMQNLHYSDDNSLDKEDKFAKVRLLFDEMNRKFISFAPIEESHSVDESMVPYYGQHGTKQFIRGKPIRWGYKLWTGATRLGYIEWFEPYQGASTVLADEYKHLGLGASVVLQSSNAIQNNFPNVSFHLYFDNFFTSFKLLDGLKSRGLKATGTVRKNRIDKNCGLPHSKTFEAEERGYFDYASTKGNDVLVCKWQDNNVVTIASNSCTVFPLHTVKRYSAKEKKKISLRQPNLIKMYNNNMGGVDRADQNISLYRVSIRGKKWYFPLIAHCLDMAEQNAWVLYKSNGGKLDHLNFRREIAVGLLETHKRNTRKGRSKPSSRLHAYSRYDGLGHLIIYKELQTRCGHCHKKCNFTCQKCSVALHPKECFFAYHTE